MLLISSSVAVCFRTIPEVPSFIAWTNSFLSSEAVSTMTRVLLRGRLQPLQGRKPVQSGHLQIQQQDIGFKLLQHVQHLPPIRCLGDHFEIFLQGQQFAETVPEDWMIVCHYNSDLGLCWQSRCVS